MKGHPEIFEIHATRDSKVANGEFWHSDVSCDEEPPLAQCYRFISYLHVGVIRCLAICIQHMTHYLNLLNK